MDKVFKEFVADTYGDYVEVEVFPAFGEGPITAGIPVCNITIESSLDDSAVSLDLEGVRELIGTLNRAEAVMASVTADAPH